MTDKRWLAGGSRWLLSCGALGAGEWLAASAPNFAESWPALLMLLVLLAVFGYALACPGWPLAALFLLGLTLFYLATVEQERQYRERPWMRGRERAWRTPEVSPPLKAIRRELAGRVSLGLAARPELAALNRAILLGERSRMPRSVKEVFIASGTLHVFAISGLHVTAVAVVLSLLLRIFGFVPRRWAELAALPWLWGYVAVIGCPPSALRAALMASFGALAPVAWRRPDGLRAWSLTFLLVHGVRPMAIVDVGSVLSFAVMLAIILAGRWAQDFAYAWQRSLAVTFAAWAAGVPIAAHVFGRVTPGGLLANLVLLTAAKWTVFTGALGVCVSYGSAAVAAHLNNLSALCTELMVLVSETVSRLPGAHFETAGWSVRVCALWYAGLLLLLWGLTVGRRRRSSI